MSNVTKIELYKIFSKAQVYIIIVVGLIVQVTMASQMRAIMFDGYRKSVYESYMKELEGQYSSEKKEYIDSECERFQAVLDNENDNKAAYESGKIDGEKYHSIIEDEKTARYRMPTLEYIADKTNYYDSVEQKTEFFYDIEVKDYVENLGFNIISMIVILLIVIPIYTDDVYAGTVYMIKSSKNGRRVLFLSRLKITLAISIIINILFAVTEFISKYCFFNLGNLKAGVVSLMIERINRLPGFLSEISIWQYIVILYLIYLLISVIISIIGLIVSKLSRGNIEAFTIMSIVVIGTTLLI